MKKNIIEEIFKEFIPPTTKQKYNEALKYLCKNVDCPIDIIKDDSYCSDDCGWRKDNVPCWINVKNGHHDDENKKGQHEIDNGRKDRGDRDEQPGKVDLFEQIGTANQTIR